jgi:hypothetical protein
LIDFGVAADDTTRPAPELVLDLTQESLAGFLATGPGGTPPSKLASFGAVLVAPRNGARSTVTVGVRCGTMGYIDPICLARGEPATPASDLYALGATLFQCVVGLVPALADSPGHTMSCAVLTGRKRAPSLAKLAPSLSKPFAALIDSLLEPDPSARPPSAAVLVQRLDSIAWLSSGAIALPDPSPSRPPLPPPSPSRPPLPNASPSRPPLPAPSPSRPPLPANPTPRRSGVQVFDGVGVHTVGNVMVAVHVGDGRAHRARFFHDCLDRLADQLGREVVCLLCIMSTSDLPDTAARTEYAKRFRAQPALRRIVAVGIGDELWRNVVRSVFHGMNQAYGPVGRFRSADSVAQGIADVLEGNEAEPVSTVQVQATLELVSQELGVRVQ